MTKTWESKQRCQEMRDLNNRNDDSNDNDGSNNEKMPNMADQKGEALQHWKWE